jgi:peptidyl-prolyl cis-trans isomerase SurA
VNLNGNISFANIKALLSPQPKQLEETRGLVISDYQTALEKEWIESLRNKYTVKVNQSVLDSIIQ